MEGSEPLPFNWGALVPLVVHPVKVAIIEALSWIGEPLSAVDLKQVVAEEIPQSSSSSSTSYVSYHVGGLAKLGVIVKVGERQVRGAVKKSYFFPPPEKNAANSPTGAESPCQQAMDAPAV